MGQCLSVLSRGRRQTRVQSLKVKKREKGRRKKDGSVETLKEKGEESKLAAEENENCHQNTESDNEVNSFLSVSEESFILNDQDKMNVQKHTKPEDAAKRIEDTDTDDSKSNAVEMEGESQLDGNLPTAASGKSSSTGNNSCRVILVKSAEEEENVSFASCNNIALASAAGEISKKLLKITDNKEFVKSVEKEDEHKSEDKIKVKPLKQEYLERKSSKVSSTCANSSSDQSTKNKHGKNAPYWVLPSTSLNKRPCLTYKADKVNIQTEMKNIDSEMVALLKPDEKTMKTSITFAICEGGAKSRPKLHNDLQSSKELKWTKKQIHEKQTNAEIRRNENIAKRIQSARRRSKPKHVHEDVTKQSNNTMYRMGVIARRDEILNQRVLAAQKASQLKTDVIQSREMETAKVKEQVLEKIGAATARRHDIIKQRVQTAIKSNELRKNAEKDREVEMERTKEFVFEKMEEATVRRNAILNQRVETLKKCSESKGDIAKERQVKMADIQQHDLQKKLNKTQDNRERILKKKVRRQVELEKRRELTRRNVRTNSFITYVHLLQETYC